MDFSSPEQCYDLGSAERQNKNKRRKENEKSSLLSSEVRKIGESKDDRTRISDR
jgi:hypothetical protein